MNGVKKLACGVVLSVAVAFGAANAWADPASSYVSVSSGDATIVDLGDQFAVVFSNAQSSATLTALQDCYLLRSLVVGGGGGGGRVMGGGGGGGQVLERSALVAFSANDEFTITVGAGGEWTAPTEPRRLSIRMALRLTPMAAGEAADSPKPSRQRRRTA